nr:class I SAM-dependent methyltransferase [Gammaproteobacteria bacterium]
MAMASAKEHYDGHLGPIYSWMAGDFAALKTRSADLFDRLGLEPGSSPRAVDLGAGHGAQSVALAERGFEVFAIDFCRPLLEELRHNARGLPVTPIEADLLELDRHVPPPVGVVVCMGDTLTHLPTTDDVEGLIRQSAAVLAPGGMFVATFRDYVSRELRQEARFIPVRSEDARILTCFLEYSESTVTVYDLVHERVDGGWRQRLSSYRKLRLDPEWLERVCAEAGLRTIERESSAGVITFVAVREPVGG